jgi:hypothetical protein
MGKIEKCEIRYPNIRHGGRGYWVGREDPDPMDQERRPTA